ncbi:MAG: DNRLRE domain-containing protein [Planctomycetes bacterium]|nr:DNRLRE domain-containing protein [Planctomycetota bacterium]
MARIGVKRGGLLAVLLYAGALNISLAGEPVELAPEKDVTIYSANAAEQWKGEGAKNSIQLGSNKDGKMRVLMAWDFKGDAAKPCGAAVLKLQTDECWPNKDALTIQVHRLLRPFDEPAASWGRSVEGDDWVNAGGDFDPLPICGRHLTKKDEGKGGKSIEIDVTPLVQGWQAKRIPNYGLALTFAADGDSYARFFSKDSANAPQLQLYYASAPPKNPDMAAAATLKPVGAAPKLKFEVYVANLNRGLVGTAYKASLRARGGVGPYKWKAEGLAEGLALGEDGVLSGTPAKAGSYALTVTVTGADGKMATGKLALEIDAPGAKPGVDLAKADPGAKKPDATAKAAKKSGAVDDE